MEANISHKDYLKVIDALLKVSSLISSQQSKSEIYERIHHIISEVIYAKNIAIFLYDGEKKEITFDYFVDEKDDFDIIGSTMSIGDGVSSYVINQNKPCLFSNEDLKTLENEGKISRILGSISTSWMGAPISNAEGVMGIIILQSYTEEETYHEGDLQILSFVASNLAIVLEQRKLLSKELEAKRSLESSVEVIQKQNHELENMMETLKDTQQELIQKEKMASLGNLVAGIAHEINTPIGICVTAVTNLHYEYKSLQKKIAAETATDKHLSYFFEDVDEACKIIESNTSRAADLINSFKEIAVDQSSEAARKINLAHYFEEIMLSLRPVLKKLPHKVELNCPATIFIETVPGAISQIFTNLINNSIIHGLKDIDDGRIKISVEEQGNSVVINYSDNGHGLNEHEMKMLFEPFYTTKRGSGGSGLGTHLIYNLVTSTLNGKIAVSSGEGEGLNYTISLPTQ